MTPRIIARNALVKYQNDHLECKPDADESLNAAALACYGASRDAGWWPEHLDDDNYVQKCLLIVSEIAEAMEGLRKSDPDNGYWKPDEKLPHRSEFSCELADIIIRTLDLAGRTETNLHYYEGVDWKSVTYLLVVDHMDSAGFKRDDRDQFAVCALLLMANAASRVGLHTHAYNSRGFSADLQQVVTLCFHLASLYDIDLPARVAEKMAFNAKRADHKVDARQAAGGKRF